MACCSQLLLLLLAATLSAQTLANDRRSLKGAPVVCPPPGLDAANLTLDDLSKYISAPWYTQEQV